MVIKGFLHTKGGNIYNAEGEKILLKGVGLGNWLLPEGYMWKFYKSCDRPRRIEELIQKLVGEKKANQFWEQFRENYIREADIECIAKEGFNSIRLPVNYRVIQDEKTGNLLEDGITHIDKVINWCTRYGLYVILDLHGAPGGQTGTNIDDSENDLPELFMKESNQARTIQLWYQLAKRYKDNETIGGFDLLNEPLPQWFSQYNDRVLPLYREITAAIRQVDKNHMIILEGVHWSTDWSIFNELSSKSFDDNYMLQFHKYWSNPDEESIKPYLDMGEKLNIPIFMGEGGENNKDWYTGVFQLYEDFNISWNFWVWKKLDTNNSPCSIKLPKDWQRIIDYLEGNISLDRNAAWRILSEYLENIPFEKCHYNKAAVNSILRRIPFKIPAEYYGYKGENVDFHVEKPVENSVGFREEDKSRIQFVKGEGILNFKHYGGEEKREEEELYLEIRKGEWFYYTFHSEKKSLNKIVLKVLALEPDTKLKLSINEAATIERVIDGMEIYEEMIDKKIMLEDYSNRMKISCEEGSLKLFWINLM